MTPPLLFRLSLPTSRQITKLTLATAALAAPASPAADKITYDDDIFPIFESKCLNCHNPDKKKGDLNLATYTGTMAGSSGGKIALAGDGGSSKLFTVAAHLEEPVMPPEGEKIAKKDADLIRAWIDGGLLENKGSKAKKRKKPAFELGAVPTGEKPDGPPPMPLDLLLDPIVTPERATVIADMESSPWAPLLAVTVPRQVLLFHSESLELLGILPFPKGNPETLSFHPSGKYLIAGGGIGGKSGTTMTWDVTTGEVMMTLGREFDSVLAADLRADLGGVALGGPSRLVKIWDPGLGEQTKSIKKHTDWVTALAYSPDGVLLATGDRNNGVQIWEAMTGNEFHSLRGHQDAITDLKWRADSNLVASASEDGTIRFWDMNRGNEIKKGNAGSGVLALDYARNGRLISVGRDKRVKLWKPDLTLEKQANPATHLLTEVAFSHNAERFFTADWNGHIEVWKSDDLTKLGELSANPPSIATRLATLTREESGLAAEVGTLREKLATTKTTVDKMRQDKADRESRLADLSKTNPALKRQAQSLETSLQQLDKKINKMRQKRDQLAKEAADKNVEDPQVDKLGTQLQELIDRRENDRSTLSVLTTEMKNLTGRIATLQKESEDLQKQLPSAEKAVGEAEANLQKATQQLQTLRTQLRKWQAAKINTELLTTRQELAALALEKEEDPSLAPRIAELEKRRDDLSKQYQAAQSGE